MPSVRSMVPFPRMQLILSTDGGARGNPGPAAAGGVLADARGRVLDSFSHYLGTCTNNVAEYCALIEGLERAAHFCASASCSGVEVRMDSELIVKQMRGEYRVRHPQLKPLYDRARALAEALPCGVSFVHVPREENKEADRLVNEALDKKAKER